MLICIIVLGLAKICYYIYYIISTGNVERPDEFVTQLNGIPLAEEIMDSLARKFIEEGKAEGKIEGKAEGKAEAKAEIAISMLYKGININLISELTGLTKKEIMKLKK